MRRSIIAVALVVALPFGEARGQTSGNQSPTVADRGYLVSSGSGYAVWEKEGQVAGGSGYLVSSGSGYLVSSGSGYAVWEKEGQVAGGSGYLVSSGSGYLVSSGSARR